MINYLIAIIGLLNLILCGDNFIEVLRIEERTQQALKDLETQSYYINVPKDTVRGESATDSPNKLQDSNRDVRTSLVDASASTQRVRTNTIVVSISSLGLVIVFVLVFLQHRKSTARRS
jgi:hypothetical protein